MVHRLLHKHGCARSGLFCMLGCPIRVPKRSHKRNLTLEVGKSETNSQVELREIRCISDLQHAK